jgi:predicted lipoprotein with Yx(FWY)xxD motif
MAESTGGMPIRGAATESTWRRARGVQPLRITAFAGACIVLLFGWSSAALAANGPTVSIGSNATFGQILTDAQGKALYTFSGDHSAVGTCTGGCAAVWPPLTIPNGTMPSAGAGVPGTLAAALQPDGATQVTYNGSPLYGFVSDSSPGQVTGDGISGFSVVKVTALTPAPTTTTQVVSTSTSPSTPTASTPTSAPPTAASTPTTSPTYSASPGVTTPVTPATPSAAAPQVANAPAIAASGGALATTGPGPVLELVLVLGVALTGLGLLPYAARRFRKALQRH